MAKVPGRHFLHNLFAGRTLLFQLVRRDFKQRFIGSAAGWVWGLIQPLVLLAVWTFVFHICFKQTPPPGSGTDNYSLYLFCSMLPWLLFQESVLRSTSTLLENANLITKTVFPSEILPVAIFLSSVMTHLLALALLLIVLAVWGGGISGMAVLLPVYMLPLGMLAVGIGWIASSLQVYLRDTSQFIQIVMQLWFWITPIFITEDLVPERLRFLIRYNPITYVVNGYRERLLTYDTPSLSEFGMLALWAAAVFVAGGLFFRHLKRGFADVL